MRRSHDGRRSLIVRRRYRTATLAGAFVATVAGRAMAQQSVERRLAVGSGAGIKAFVPVGSIRLIAWNRDTVLVKGTVAKGSRFFFGGSTSGMKFGVDDPADGASALTVALGPSHFDVYVPASSSVSIKTVSADIDGDNTSGWFYTVSGHIRLGGTARSVEAESMAGPLALNVSAPSVRARTGSGRLAVGGVVEDLSATSVDGPVVLTATGLARARVSTVTGDIGFVAALGSSGVADVDSYGGGIELGLPATLGGQCDLTSVEGLIVSDFAAVQPTADASGRGQQMSLIVGRGSARVTVRALKGKIHVRRAS